MVYDFLFAAIDAKIIRSRAIDTDYATLAVTVLDAGDTVSHWGPETTSLGEIGHDSVGKYPVNGNRVVNLCASGLDVPDGGSLAVSATVANQGSWSGTGTLGGTNYSRRGDRWRGRQRGDRGYNGSRGDGLELAGRCNHGWSRGGVGDLRSFPCRLRWLGCDRRVQPDRTWLDSHPPLVNSNVTWDWNQEYKGGDTPAGCNDFDYSQGMLSAAPAKL